MNTAALTGGVAAATGYEGGGVKKRETLEDAYRIAKRNGGASGLDGQTFEDIEAAGLTVFLAEIQNDLLTGRYKPQPNRRVAIPKEHGKVRILPIPCLRDRVWQEALKLILAALFEADFCPNSYGYRPQRSPHRALAELRRSGLRRMSPVIDVDRSRYFDMRRSTIDDIAITVSGHHPKRGWAERALQRLEEQLAPRGVALNREKTQLVDTLSGEAFGFLGFDLRRGRKRKGEGYYLLMTPKKKARKAIKAKVRDLIRRGGAIPAKEMVAHLNAALAGWVHYFRVGNSSRAFSEGRDYVEMKVRTLLTRRKRWRKREPRLAAME